eukprot:Em0018g1159a
MGFVCVYGLLATDEVDRVETLEHAKNVVDGSQTACKVLLKYGINLLNLPQKLEFRRIKLSSNSYLYRVSNKLLGAEKVLIQMGYQLTADGQELVYEGNINRDAIIETIADLVILYAMLELYLRWLQEAKEHGKHFKLKEIIDYCKAGFAHSQILTVLTNSQSTCGNRHERSGHTQQYRHSKQDDSCQDRDSQNGFSAEGNNLCPSVSCHDTVTPKVQQGTGIVQMKNEHQVLRQTSWPHNGSVTPQDEGHTLARSISLEGSQGSGGLSQLESNQDLHKMIVETSQSAGFDLVCTPGDFSTTANKIRSEVASRWECAYCMFLNPTANVLCEVCKHKL